MKSIFYLLIKYSDHLHQHRRPLQTSNIDENISKYTIYIIYSLVNNKNTVNKNCYIHWKKAYNFIYSAELTGEFVASGNGVTLGPICSRACNAYCAILKP